MGPMYYVVCKYHEDAYDDFSERDILSSGECFSKLEDATAECVRLCREEASKYMPEPEIKTEKGKASFSAGTETYEFYVVGLPLKNPYAPR